MFFEYNLCGYSLSCLHFVSLLRQFGYSNISGEYCDITTRQAVLKNTRVEKTAQSSRASKFGSQHTWQIAHNLL